MNTTVNIGISENQRELLLRGLRHIRSSVLLEMRNPAENETELRNARLHDIENLVEQLSESRSAEVTAGV